MNEVIIYSKDGNSVSYHFERLEIKKDYIEINIDAVRTIFFELEDICNLNIKELKVI